MSVNCRHSECRDSYECKWQAPQATMAWGNFCKIGFYGWARWPSYSYWIVPGSITDEERAG